MWPQNSTPKMDRKCRLCLKICKGRATVRTIMDDGFRRKILDVFTFPIAIDANLPAMVCMKCTNQIEHFHVFSERVRAIQKQLMLLVVQEQNQQILPDNIKVDSPEMEEKVNMNENEVLFEEVQLQSTEKEQCFTMETNTNNIEPPAEIREDKADLHEKTYEEEETETETESDIDPIFVKNSKNMRKPSKNIDDESTCIVPEQRQRKRNEQDNRISKHYKMECEICSKCLTTFSELQAHFRSDHNSRAYIRCCDKVLLRRAKLIEHMLFHEGSLQCDICQKSYKCSRSLNLHKLNSHSAAEDKPFKCDKCHQSYAKQHLLTAHLVRHVQQQCSVCKKNLSNSQALAVHVAQVHGEDSNRICATCGKAFRTKRAMERHIKEHLGLELVERLQCEHCKKWFNGKYNLKKHIRFIHMEKGQEFPCDICQHKYPNTRALQYHKQRVHVEERFECEYCGKRFKRKITLKEHIASHTRQPLYSCTLCDATFISNGNLYAHRRRKHSVGRTNSKPPEGLETTVEMETFA